MEVNKLKTRFNKFVDEMQKEFEGKLIFGNFAIPEPNSTRRSELCVEKEVSSSRYFKQVFKNNIKKYKLEELNIKAIAVKRQIIR